MHPRQPLPPSATSLIRLQAGVLTRAQAIGCGVAPNAVTRMARQWQTLSPGVFLATPAADGRLSWEVRAWAGLLRFGPQARLWLDDAGVVHGLVEVPAPVHPGRIDANPIQLLVPWHNGRDVPGYLLTRERSRTREPSTRSDPAATRVDDTVLDLIDHGGTDDVVTWLTRAVQRRRTTPTRLLRRLEDRRRVRHRRLVLEVLRDVAAGSTTHLEMALVNDVLRPHGLPVGRRQHRVIRTVGLTDVGYPEYQLIVEVDGRIGHEGEGAFRDKHRDNDHTIVGWTSLRFGWDDVSADPCAVAAYIAEMLIQRGWSGYPDRCPRCEHRPFR